MKRRDFVTQFVAASGVLLTGMKAMAQEVTARSVVVERPVVDPAGRVASLRPA